MHLENYIKGENPAKIYLKEFIDSPGDSLEFVNNNYIGNYYGINVYDYLIGRIKEEYSFLKKRNEEHLSVLEIRSLNILQKHKEIIQGILLDIYPDYSNGLLERFNKIEKN